MRDTLTQLQEDVLRVVMDRRKRNPITGKEIASVVGLKPRRTGKERANLRSIVNALRVKGYPVCASGEGYWWPDNENELDEYINRFEARMMDMSKAIASMRFGKNKMIPTEVSKEIDAKKVYYYEVPVEGEGRKCFKVVGARIEEFLAKYPTAKKL